MPMLNFKEQQGKAKRCCSSKKFTYIQRQPAQVLTGDPLGVTLGRETITGSGNSLHGK